MPINVNRIAIKATAAEGVAKSRGVGYQTSVWACSGMTRATYKLHGSAQDHDDTLARNKLWILDQERSQREVEQR